jgi:hypothetical protein
VSQKPLRNTSHQFPITSPPLQASIQMQKEGLFRMPPDQVKRIDDLQVADDLETVIGIVHGYTVAPWNRVLHFALPWASEVRPAACVRRSRLFHDRMLASYRHKLHSAQHYHNLLIERFHAVVCRPRARCTLRASAWRAPLRSSTIMSWPGGYLGMGLGRLRGVSAAAAGPAAALISCVASTLAHIAYLTHVTPSLFAVPSSPPPEAKDITLGACLRRLRDPLTGQAPSRERLLAEVGNQIMAPETAAHTLSWLL